MIVCIGEAVIDMVQTNVPGLGEVFLPLPGGCSYNTSIAISRLGTPAAFLGRLSTNFFGEILVKRLRENNVRDDLLIRCDQNSILAFVRIEKGKDPQYAFYDEGTSDRFLLPENLKPLPAETTCIVFGSISMTMEPIASTIEKLILKEAERKKSVIALDPNIRPIMIGDRDAYIKRFEKWVGASTITKISSEDLEYIFPNTEPEEALRKIIDMGSRLAIATLGPNGAIAMLHCADGVIRVSASAAQIPEVADTVGAGDTFHGAFLSWLHQRGKMSHNAIAGLNENDLYDALVFANKAAAIVCTRRGAEPPNMEEIEKLSIEK